MIEGVLVGHWDDTAARTGCTVALFPEGTVASGEVRGGAPGTREWALLDPTRVVSRLDAVVLAGGSAFGLASCDGVMQWCEEHGRGFPTAAGVVPIVVGAVLFDLAVGDGRVRPTAADGRRACERAVAGPVPCGAHGAAAGATVSKWRGREWSRPGGLGWAQVRDGEIVVSALIAVNAWGDVVGDGSLVVDGAAEVFANRGFADTAAAAANTTIGIVATNVRLDKIGCQLMAQSAHDGLARAIWPVHSTVDGDAIVAASVPVPGEGERVDAHIDLVRMLTVEATARAVRAAVPVG